MYSDICTYKICLIYILRFIHKSINMIYIGGNLNVLRIHIMYIYICLRYVYTVCIMSDRFDLYFPVL